MIADIFYAAAWERQGEENGYETFKKEWIDRTTEETDSVSTFASALHDYDRNFFLCTVVWMELCICRIYTWCFNF